MIGAYIDGGLYIAHPIGIVSADRQISRNCSIIANVIIGLSNDHALPVKGDIVFLGSGARVLSGINVGDGAVIGANAVVIEDVPPEATVVGVLTKVIRINGERVVEKN
jgi:serine O-acetyltransferase